jgi:hypothetical protein
MIIVIMSKINFYNYVKPEKVINPNFETHNIKVPFRMLIAAPSGSGKTNALMNLIMHMDKTFHEIIVCVKSADEPLYEMLINKLKNVVVFENGEVPPLSDYSKIDEKTKRLKRIDKKQRLIVFDDLITDRNANIRAAEYYIKARKLGFSMCYISQSFYQIPKIIRDNTQLFILGRNLLNKDLRMILSAFPTELTLDEFTNLYNELTSEDLDVVLINIDKKYISRNIIGDKINL